MTPDQMVRTMAEMASKTSMAYASYVEAVLRQLGANEHTIGEFEIRSFNTEQGENHVYRQGVRVATISWKIDHSKSGLLWLMAVCRTPEEGTDSE